MMDQSSQPGKGIGRSREGIEIWNRNWDEYKAHLFPEDPGIISRFSFLKLHAHQQMWKNPQYWHVPAGTQYDSTYTRKKEIITSQGPIIGLHDFFKPNTTVINPGCGEGVAAMGMAKDYKHTEILAVDYEFGHAVPLPTHSLSNLTYQNQDWRNFSLPEDSIDAIVSDQGIGLYGNTQEVVKEMTRIAKVGAVYRGTATRAMMGIPNFSDRLAEAGWDVWILRKPNGEATDLTVARLIRK